MKIFLPHIHTADDQRILFDYTIDLSHEEVNFSRPFCHPVRVVGSVADSAGMIRLEGSIQALISANCARCDIPVEYDKTVDVSFMLATALEDEDIDDIWVVEGDWVDLDEIFVPELLMDMEMSVLCSEDCKGLCQKCGKNLNQGQCDCPTKEIDPRLEKLAQMLDKLDK